MSSSLKLGGLIVLSAAIIFVYSVHMAAPHTRQVKKGQILLYQGEVPTGIYYIKDGLARASNISSTGDEKTIALFGNGDYFPIGFLFHKSPVALFYYEAISDSTMEFYSREAFLAKLKQERDFESLSHIATQYVSSLLQINALGQTKARDRVLRILQFLALRFGENSKLGGKSYVKIIISFTQQDIGRIAGLTRETTAIELNKLKREEIIVVRKKFYTIHLKKLLQAIGEEELDNVSL